MALFRYNRNKQWVDSFMKWFNINSNDNDSTDAMEIGKGVLIHTSSYNSHRVPVSEALCFVPHCRIKQGGCGERSEVVSRTETR